MKITHLFVVALLLSVPPFSAAQSTTPHLNLSKPARHDPDWNTPINGNFDILDNLVPASSCLTDGTQAANWDGINKRFFCQTVTAGSGSIVGSPAIGTQVIGNGTTFVPQAKSVYDTRDWMTCDGVTNASAGMGALLNAIGSSNATIRVIGKCLVGSLRFPPTVALDFSSGGSLALIVDHTAPGGGQFVQGAGAVNASASPTSSCSVTLPGTIGGANHAILMMVALYKTFTPDNARISSVSDGSNFYIQQQQTTLGQAAYVASYLAASISGGSVTVTANFSAAEKNACIAWEISGLGPTPAADGNGVFAYGSTTPFSSGAGTFLSQDFLVNYGEDPNDAQTCTAGAGYTQPASTAGNVSGTSGPALCAEYDLSGAGGSTTATQNFSTSPVLSSWGDALLGLRPGSATVNILGGVFNPDLHQIFYNATGTDGVVDFTGNTAAFSVHPEWWGAFPSNTGAQNTAPVQAAIHGAFGTKRTNSSGLSIYNKPLYLNGAYQINDELKWYSVNNFEVYCNGALHGGLIQTAANKRIMDAQSMAYGSFHNCLWQGTANNTNALLDIDYNGVDTVGDLAPQFLDFYKNIFIGNGSDDVGLLGAKSGGGAQFSNIYCHDCAGQGFSGAVWQIGGNGTGRNAGRFYALNALNIGWTGDMQNCPHYGFASYGAGYIEIDNSSFECNSPLASYLTTAATGFDVYGEATQGPITVTNSRSEDLQLIHASSPRVFNTAQIDQSTAFYSPVNCLAGGSEPLNWFIHGSDLGSDGALYQITVHGTALGGYCRAQASSGTATTITDTNQIVVGSVTIGAFGVVGETMTQAVTGATGTRLNIPVSTGTITGSVTRGTIGSAHTMTQATTGVTCTSTNAPTGTQSLTCNNFSGAADSSHIWTDGTTSGTYTPTAVPAFSVASPAMIITAATGSPDNSHDWVGGTSGAHLTPTAVPVNEVNWTVNQFVGGAGAQQQVTIWAGTGIGTVCSPITANTATSITFTSCTSNFAGVHAATFDTTSAFIVEPCWGCGVTQSGDFTFAKVNTVVIGGDNLNVSSSACQIDGVLTSGGLIQCGGSGGTFTNIRNLTVSRPDWYGPTSGGGFKMSDATISQVLNQVQVLRTYSAQVTTGRLKWSIGGRNSNTNIVSAPLQTQMGTSPLVWSCGGAGGGLACNDVSLGGRSDPGATTNTFRNRMEYSGMLGAAAPSGFNMTDQNGAATTIGGGPSTGAGVPGPIEFWIGSTAATGAAVNTGTKYAFIDYQGWHPPQATFAALGAAPYSTSPNGSVVFCTDCKNVTDDTTGTFDSAIASGGHGTMVLMENGSWRVH